MYVPGTRALRITKVQDFHAGTYRCLATKIFGGGCIYHSDNATLTVKGMRLETFHKFQCITRMHWMRSNWSNYIPTHNNKIPFPRTCTISCKVTKGINERPMCASFLAIIQLAHQMTNIHSHWVHPTQFCIPAIHDNFFDVMKFSTGATCHIIIIDYVFHSRSPSTHACGRPILLLSYCLAEPSQHFTLLRPHHWLWCKAGRSWHQAGGDSASRLVGHILQSSSNGWRIP